MNSGIKKTSPICAGNTGPNRRKSQPVPSIISWETKVKAYRHSQRENEREVTQEHIPVLSGISLIHLTFH